MATHIIFHRARLFQIITIQFYCVVKCHHHLSGKLYLVEALARYKNKYARRSNNIGYERARQHIEEARQLTNELGGTDQDVKKWFFSRSPSQLEAIFRAYGKTYGINKATYAREVYPSWKSGERQMSGMVAERLFKLLPNMMPLEEKYSLVESLWQHVGPSKKRLVKCGGNTPIELVVSAVESEVMKLVTDWDIPDTLTNRFKWLAANDSIIYQQLLSHIKEQERKLGEATLRHHIPELRAKYNEMSDITSRLSYQINVNKQFVELRIEGDGDNLTVDDWVPVQTPNSLGELTGNISWIWWVLGAIALFFFLK